MQLAIRSFAVSGISTMVLNLLNLFSAWTTISKFISGVYYSVAWAFDFRSSRYVSSNIFFSSDLFDGKRARIDI